MTHKISLKWQCHEIFWHFFLFPPGPLINRLKWRFLKIRFIGDIREISDSAQANTLRRIRKINFRQSKIG